MTLQVNHQQPLNGNKSKEDRSITDKKVSDIDAIKKHRNESEEKFTMMKEALL